MEDIDDVLTKQAIRNGLELYGLYFETIDSNDGNRAEQIGRLARAAAAELGVKVTVAATRRRDAGVQLCVMVVGSPAEPEPEPAA